MVEQFDQIFDSVEEAADAIGEQLGLTEQQIDSAVSGVDLAETLGEISLKGEAEEITERLSEAFSMVADAVGYELAPDLINKFAKLGETYFDTLTRVVTDKVIIEDIFKMSGQSVGTVQAISALSAIGNFETLDYVTLNADIYEVSQSLVELAGGVGELRDAASDYFSEFFTEEEQFAKLTQDLHDQFSTINSVLPETREGYRALVEAQNLGIEADRERYVTLLQLSDMADQYYDDLESGAYDAASAIESAMASISATVESYKLKTLQIEDPEEYDATMRATEVAEVYAEAFETAIEGGLEGSDAIAQAEKARQAVEEYFAALDTQAKVAELTRAAEEAAREAEAAAAERARERARAAEEAAREAERVAQVTQGLTDQLLQLQDTEAYELLLRDRQLASLNDYQQSIQLQIWTLEDAAIAAEEAARLEEELAAARQSSIDDAFNALQLAVDAEKDLLSQAHDARMEALGIELDAANESVTALTNLQNALGNAFDSIMSSANQSLMDYSMAQAALVSVYGQAQSGYLPELGDIEDYLSVVTSNDSSNYVSQAEFLADQKFTANVLAGINEVAGSQLPIEQQTLSAIESQIELADLSYEQQIEALDATLEYWQNEIDALESIDQSVMTVAQAVANLQSVISGEPATVPTSVPAFASGGIHTGGLRLVGENGPELEFTGPSRIMSNNDTLKMLDNSDLIREVQALRGEVSRLRQERKQDATRDYKELSKTRKSNEAILTLQQPATAYTGDLV